MDKKSGKIIFGPVPSRRLGRSLGVDILPLKSCNLNCVYCELGPTREYTTDFVCPIRPEEIEEAFLEFMASNHLPFDVVTITASGEPTLHKDLGDIIERIKRHSDRPLALLTNSTLLHVPDVKYAIKEIDMLLPSLDAGSEAVFKRVNRPARGVGFDAMVAGLLDLRAGYQGKILLEILFVKGINDTEEELERLRGLVEGISPDEVQVSTIARPPAESWAQRVEDEALLEIASTFGEKARIVTSFSGPKERASAVPGDQEILELLKRRPLNREDLRALFHPYEAQVLSRLEGLVAKGVIKKGIVDKKEFFLARDQ